MKNTHGVATTAYASYHGIGLTATRHLGHLHNALVTDDALKVPDHHGVRVWTGHGTDDVEGVVDIGDPVPHGFVQGIF